MIHEFALPYLVEVKLFFWSIKQLYVQTAGLGAKSGAKSSVM